MSLYLSVVTSVIFVAQQNFTRYIISFQNLKIYQRVKINQRECFSTIKKTFCDNKTWAAHMIEKDKMVYTCTCPFHPPFPNADWFVKKFLSQYINAPGQEHKHRYEISIKIQIYSGFSYYHSVSSPKKTCQNWLLIDKQYCWLSGGGWGLNKTTTWATSASFIIISITMATFLKPRFQF